MSKYCKFANIEVIIFFIIQFLPGQSITKILNNKMNMYSRYPEIDSKYKYHLHFMNMNLQG